MMRLTCLLSLVINLYQVQVLATPFDPKVEPRIIMYDREISKLTGSTAEPFVGFCVDTRDFVMDDIKSRGEEDNTGKMLNVLLSSFEEQAAWAKLGMVKSVMDKQALGEALGEACAKLKAYGDHIREAFNEARAQAEASIGLDEVPCMTAPRVLRLESLCKHAESDTFIRFVASKLGVNF